MRAAMVWATGLTLTALAGQVTAQERSREYAARVTFQGDGVNGYSQYYAKIGVRYALLNCLGTIHILYKTVPEEFQISDYVYQLDGEHHFKEHTTAPSPSSKYGTPIPAALWDMQVERTTFAGTARIDWERLPVAIRHTRLQTVALREFHDDAAGPVELAGCLGQSKILGEFKDILPGATAAERQAVLDVIEVHLRSAPPLRNSALEQALRASLRAGSERRTTSGRSGSSTRVSGSSGASGAASGSSGASGTASSAREKNTKSSANASSAAATPAISYSTYMRNQWLLAENHLARGEYAQAKAIYQQLRVDPGYREQADQRLASIQNAELTGAAVAFAEAVAPVAQAVAAEMSSLYGGFMVGVGYQQSPYEDDGAIIGVSFGASDRDLIPFGFYLDLGLGTGEDPEVDGVTRADLSFGLGITIPKMDWSPSSGTLISPHLGYRLIVGSLNKPTGAESPATHAPMLGLLWGSGNWFLRGEVVPMARKTTFGGALGITF